MTELRRRNRQIHPKVVGATLGTAISGLIAAELTLRCGLRLLPEEYVAIQIVGAFLGGFYKRYTPA